MVISRIQQQFCVINYSSKSVQALCRDLDLSNTYKLSQLLEQVLADIATNFIIISLNKTKFLNKIIYLHFTMNKGIFEVSSMYLTQFICHNTITTGDNISLKKYNFILQYILVTIEYGRYISQFVFLHVFVELV